MALRKAGSYSSKYTRPYTRRSAKKSKSYIRAVPNQKVVKFRMGDINGFDSGNFKYTLTVLTTEKVQIRDTALEAARQYIHKELEDNYLGQYYLGVQVFPHHILRENKMLTGAGSDRMQTGMAHSFGATIGRAALVKEGGEIFIIAINSEKALIFSREIIRKVKSKLPCTTRVLTDIKK
jgi:large subunit ribosomal protein L10e